ncbi:MAG: hypothetical protein IT328_18400 [Caldilineaceae bacterium]|nr:hypothetical protein [Caldilineaceae bacterium]
MSEQQKRQLDPRKHFDREKMLLRYTVALDNGDFETIAAILQLAEIDTELERMILEINDVYAAEIEEAAHVQDAAVVRELLHKHMLSPLSESAAEPPPLTVGHVIARIHADAAQRGRVEREALAATRDYQTSDTPLPADLSVRGVSYLLQQLGIEVGRRFQDLFRDTAILMRMGRNQGVARLAATRRQQQARHKPRDSKPSGSHSEDEAAK